MSAPDPAPLPREVRWILAVAIVLPMLVVGLQLTRVDLWQDEANEIVIAQGGHTTTLDLVQRSEMRPPVRFYLLKAWLLAGESGGWVRSLSLLCLVASVPLVFAVGRRLLGDRPAVYGTLLFAGSAYQLSTGWFARSYSLDVLVTLVAVLAGLLFREAPTRQRAAVLAGAFLLAAATTYFVLPVLAIVAWDAGHALRRRGEPLGRLVAALGAAGLVYLAWLPAVFAQHRNARDNRWEALDPSWKDVGDVFVAFSLGRVKNWELASPLQLAVTLALLGLALLGLRRHRPRAFFLAAWLLLPVALLFVVSQLGPNLVIIRVLNVYAPPLYLLAGAGLLAIPWRPSAMLGAAAFVATSGVYLGRTEDLRSITDGIREATAFLRHENAAAARPVVHAEQFTWFPATVYGGGPAVILKQEVPWNWGATQIPPGVLQTDLSFLDGAEGFYLVEKATHYKERFDEWLRRVETLAASPYRPQGPPRRFDRVRVWTYRQEAAPIEEGMARELAARRQEFPHDPYPVFAEGLGRQRAGDPAGAETAFVETIELAPEWAYGHLQLGLLWARQGRLEQAVAAFARAQELDPENAQAEQLWRRAVADLERRAASASPDR